MILEPTVFEDSRGALFESFNRRAFAATTGVDAEFVQDNYSRSLRNVIRGLHYQARHPQGKLIRVLRGEIFDVAVDLRRASPSFGRWVGVTLSEANNRMLWIPPGFAHGLLALSDRADVLYKMTDYWLPADERTIAWNDPDVAVRWPIEGAPILSKKDSAGVRFADAEI